MEDTTQTKNTSTEDDVRVKRTIKDTVFSTLFGDKSNLLEMYRALHPEDKATTEDDLKDVTIGNILTDGIYNDLSFIVGNRLMVLVEAQSTWSVEYCYPRPAVFRSGLEELPGRYRGRPVPQRRCGCAKAGVLCYLHWGERHEARQAVVVKGFVPWRSGRS